MVDRRNIIGDPEKLLDFFKSHLTETGGIKRKSIPELINLMSDTNGKLVPKCISLCIISASDRTSQAQLCQDGAWSILLKWLQEALNEDNQSLLVELLNVYLHLPVRFDHLTMNVCPKLINSLSKRSENKSVRSLAADIVKKWKDVISVESSREKCQKMSQSNLALGVNVEPPIKKKKPEADGRVELNDIESGMSTIEIKKRRSTVKMPPTSMRTAGIEDSTEQIPIKSRSEVISKKTKHDSTEKSYVLPIESFHQKITVTPSEPKKVAYEIHESSDFINALTTQPVVRKKRKLPKLDSSIPIETAFVDESTKVSDISISEESDSKMSPLPDLYPPKKSSMSSFSAFTVDKKSKKRVTWASEDKLQAISFFEIDETERVNVNRISLAEIRQKELSLERQLFKRHEEIEIENAKWLPPVELELNILVEPGCKSVERQIQVERERFVLQAIYFTRESVPASPEEPEKEDFETKLPLEIPLEDLHGSESASSKEDLLIIKNEGDGKSQVSLNPEVADLVQSLVFSFTPGNDTANFPPPIPSISKTSSDGIIPSETPIHSAISPIDAKPGETCPLDKIKNNYSDAGTPKTIESSQDQTHRIGMQGLENHLPNLSSAPPSLPEGGHPKSNHLLQRPPGPHQMQHRLPMPSDVRGMVPFISSRPPRFSSDLPQMHQIPPNFSGRQVAPRPFRVPPPRMFSGPRHPINSSRGSVSRRGGRIEQVCKFFQQGNCRHGNKCSFLHPGFQSNQGW